MLNVENQIQVHVLITWYNFFLLFIHNESGCVVFECHFECTCTLKKGIHEKNKPNLD